jgi:hypothetical protein
MATRPFSIPSVFWSRMTIDRYAALEQATGSKVIKAGDIWWRQVRALPVPSAASLQKIRLKESD